MKVLFSFSIILIPFLSGCFSFSPIREKEEILDGYGALIFQPVEGWPVIIERGRSVDRRYSPCSTFKVVSMLLGLEAGSVTNLSDRLGYDGTIHEIEAWNRDVTLKEAFQVSCVWYFKKIMDKTSRGRVQQWLDRLAYGNRDLSLWNEKGHNGFWLRPGLAISPREQTAVLKKIFNGEADFPKKHISLLKACMRQKPIGKKIDFYGKTGSGRDPGTGRLEGWFIGFLELPDG